jgi:hypothetical protein
MKKSLLALALACTVGASAQDRYLEESFQINVTTDVEYGINVNFLTSTLTDLTQVNSDMTEIKTAIATGGTIAPKFFDPTDPASDIKLTRLTMDIYEPANDSITDRPVIMYIHTGNFLPPPFNGGPNGSKADSAAIVLCQQWAARGFVAVAFNYRHGWNPTSGDQEVRKGTLLNAVYRAIHDSKQAVRFIKAGASTYGIDKSKITLYGQGSGGYVALAYPTLDKYSEITLPKFTDLTTGASYVDTATVGNFEGFGQFSLSTYVPNGESSDIAMTVNAGGALADTSWLEAGDVPMVSFHCLRDPFAPFDEGTVVVPTTLGNVVDVQGPNVFLEKANALGNNNAYINFNFNDPYTVSARAKYGNTYSYIFPAPANQMTVNNNEGMYTFLRPLGNTQFENQGSPWEWWDPNSPLAQAVVSAGPPPITAHQASLISNPDMSPSKGRTYLDTIQGYMIPRVMVSLQLAGYQKLGVDESTQKVAYSLYPNPTNGLLNIETASTATIESLEVVDLSGKTVLRQAPLTSKAEVNLSQLPEGLYLINTVIDGVAQTQKVTKY